MVLAFTLGASYYVMFVYTLCFVGPIFLMPNYYVIKFWLTLLCNEFLHIWSCHVMSIKNLIQSVALYLLCNSTSQSAASKYVAFSTNLTSTTHNFVAKLFRKHITFSKYLIEAGMVRNMCYYYELV